MLPCLRVKFTSIELFCFIDNSSHANSFRVLYSKANCSNTARFKFEGFQVHAGNNCFRRIKQQIHSYFLKNLFNLYTFLWYSFSVCHASKYIHHQSIQVQSAHLRQAILGSLPLCPQMQIQQRHCNALLNVRCAYEQSISEATSSATSFVAKAIAIRSSSVI